MKLVLPPFLLLCVPVFYSSVFKVAFHWFWFRLFLSGSVTNYAI